MNLANLHVNCCQTRTDWTARIISDLANPLMFPPVLFMAVVWEFNAAPIQVFYIGTVAFSFFTLLPLGMLIYLQSRAKIESLDINDQKSRNLPFLLTLISYLIGAFILFDIQIKGAILLRLFIVCYLLNPVIGWLISQKWKISVHTASLGTVIALTFMLYQIGFKLNTVFFGKAALVLLFFLLPALMWARYHLKIHTIPQVLAGAGIGLIVTYIEIMLFSNVKIIF